MGKDEFLDMDEMMDEEDFLDMDEPMSGEDIGEMQELFADIKWYLEQPKSFMPNVERLAEIQAATETAKTLFPNATVKIKDDPLQTGALFLHIEDWDFCLVNTQIPQFFELFYNADNFEIYTREEKSVISITFQNVLVMTT